MISAYKSAHRDIKGYTHRVHRIHPLSALIAFSLYPVPVQICEQTIDIIRASRVSVPFACVVLQEQLILQRV